MIDGYLTIIIVGLTGLGLLAWITLRRKSNGPGAEVNSNPWTRSDDQMLKLMEAGSIVLTQYDASGNLKYISPEIKRITGIASIDFISGRTRLGDLVHHEDAEALAELEYARLNGHEGPASIDCRVHDQRNSWHWLHLQQRRIRSGDETVGYETIAVDYTALAELKAQKKRTAKLQALTTDVLKSFLATDDTRASLNRNLADIARELDLSEATIHEFEGKEECSLLGSWTHDDEATPALSDRPLTPEECRDVHTACEGLTPLSFGGGEKELGNWTHTLCRDRKSWNGIVVPVRVMGELCLLLTMIRDPERPWNADELSALQLIAQSISRRLERERAVQDRTHFDEIRRGHERSEIIAHLASGIAHDFNNIVFAISGRVQLLQRRTEDDKTRESLNEIQTTLKGAKGLIGALLAMHKGSPRPTGRVRIGPETRAVMAMIRRLIPRRIELSLDIDVIGDVEVKLGAESLHQILMNLVVNARDAINNKGRISVTMSRTTDVHDTPMISIDIDDDGPGIPEERRTEVFEPFVTSKSSSRGTGLGLSIVKRVINESGGHITLEDSPLGGLRVHVALPATDETAHELNAPESNEEPPDPERGARLKRVLIVEDDETIKALLTRFFESIGVDVSSFSDAREVESSLRETTPPFDVLVMDIDLPYKTGIECIKEIRGQGIQTPCVLITGGLSEKPADLDNLGFLRKPFEIDELETLCLRMLKESRES